jgi:hypothetical protein
LSAFSTKLSQHMCKRIFSHISRAQLYSSRLYWKPQSWYSSLTNNRKKRRSVVLKCIQSFRFSKRSRSVLLVTNVFGISALLVWRVMASEEAQICNTHSLKEVPNGVLGFFNLVPRENGWSYRLDVFTTDLSL